MDDLLADLEELQGESTFSDNNREASASRKRPIDDDADESGDDRAMSEDERNELTARKEAESSQKSLIQSRDITKIAKLWSSNELGKVIEVPMSMNNISWEIDFRRGFIIIQLITKLKNIPVWLKITPNMI